MGSAPTDLCNRSATPAYRVSNCSGLSSNAPDGPRVRSSTTFSGSITMTWALSSSNRLTSREIDSWIFCRVASFSSHSGSSGISGDAATAEAGGSAGFLVLSLARAIVWILSPIAPAAVMMIRSCLRLNCSSAQ